MPEYPACAGVMFIKELGVVCSNGCLVNVSILQACDVVSLTTRAGSNTNQCEPAHAQVMAKLAGVKLSKAALSHVQVPRTRYDSPLLPDAAVQVGVCDTGAATKGCFASAVSYSVHCVCTHTSRL